MHGVWRVNGEDPTCGRVARYLQPKAQPEYYENEVVMRLF